MGVWGSGDMMTSRSPHGERGLKYQMEILIREAKGSLSSRRAWIEMAEVWILCPALHVALLTESVD